MLVAALQTCCSCQSSLARRMAMLRLHCLAQCELARRAPDFLDPLFGKRFKIQRWERLAGELADRIVAGCYPAALAHPGGRRRASWYADYLDALVRRDGRDLSRVGSLDVLPRPLNVTDLAAPFQ